MRINQIEKDIPVLTGPVSGRKIIVWCPYCRCNHSHSYKKGDGYTHRSSHCGTGKGGVHSYPKGYYVIDYEAAKKRTQ